MIAAESLAALALGSAPLVAQPWRGTLRLLEACEQVNHRCDECDALVGYHLRIADCCSRRGWWADQKPEAPHGVVDLHMGSNLLKSRSRFQARAASSTMRVAHSDWGERCVANV